MEEAAKPFFYGALFGIAAGGALFAHMGRHSASRVRNYSAKVFIATLVFCALAMGGLFVSFWPR